MSVPKLRSYDYVTSLSHRDSLHLFRPDQRQRCRLDSGLHVEPDQHDSGRGPRLTAAVPRRLRLHCDADGDSALRPARRQPALFPPLQGAADRVTGSLAQRGREGGSECHVARLVGRAGRSKVNVCCTCSCSFCGHEDFSEGHIFPPSGSEFCSSS